MYNTHICISKKYMKRYYPPSPSSPPPLPPPPPPPPTPPLPPFNIIQQTQNILEYRSLVPAFYIYIYICI